MSDTDDDDMFNMTVLDNDEEGDSDSDNDEEGDSDSDSEDEKKGVMEEEEYEQVPTFRQFEHVGEANELDIIAGFDLDPKNRRKMMANLTGEERFRKIANQYINENFKGLISTSLISNLLEHIKKIEYKNPRAFVLAYYFIIKSKKDKTKDKDLSTVISEYIANEEIGIDIKDIVRYIRLIRNSVAI